MILTSFSKKAKLNDYDLFLILFRKCLTKANFIKKLEYVAFIIIFMTTQLILSEISLKYKRKKMVHLH